MQFCARSNQRDYISRFLIHNAGQFLKWQKHSNAVLAHISFFTVPSLVDKRLVIVTSSENENTSIIEGLKVESTISSPCSICSTSDLEIWVLKKCRLYVNYCYRLQSNRYIWRYIWNTNSKVAGIHRAGRLSILLSINPSDSSAWLYFIHFYL